jgi:transposase
VLTLLKRLATLEARVHQNSSNSSQPPSTDAPATKRPHRWPTAERRKPGGKPGHPGHPQVLLEPTATVALFPEGCACGPREFVELTPYHTHQVIELPVIRPDVTHWLRHQGQCLSGGTLCKATIPADQISGYGPRLTGFVGELTGIVGASRSAVQDLCPAVFGLPLSQGAIQKRIQAGESVELRGFGRFYLRHRQAWAGRNPRTGEMIPIPAKAVPTFTAGKAFQAQVQPRTAAGGAV